MRFLISRRETDSLSGYCHLESNSCTQYFVRSSHLTARGLILSTDQNPSCRCAFSMLNMQIGHCRLIVRIVSVGCEEVWPAAPEHSMVAYNRLGALAKFGSWRTSTMMSRLSFLPSVLSSSFLTYSQPLKQWKHGSICRSPIPPVCSTAALAFSCVHSKFTRSTYTRAISGTCSRHPP